VRCSGSTVAGELILVDRQGRAPVRWDVLSGRFTVWLWLRTTGAWSLAADFVDEGPLTLDEARAAAARWWQAHP
jgi:hypothetical protein